MSFRGSRLDSHDQPGICPHGVSEEVSKRNPKKYARGGMSHPPRDVLDQFPCIPSPSTVELGPEIDEVPAVVVALAHDFLLGCVQQWQEFVEEPLLPLGAQLEVQPPHPAPKDREPIVHVLAGRHPQRNAAVAVTDCSHESFDTMSVGDVLQCLAMECEALLLGPVGPVRSVDGISNHIIFDEGLGKTLGGGLVFGGRHDTDLRV